LIRSNDFHDVHMNSFSYRCKYKLRIRDAKDNQAIKPQGA
jgi:hypothetical protein